jgi:uncharacterized protein
MNDLPILTPISPVELIILQGTPLCNLNCTYCDLTEASRRTRSVMEIGLIERFFRELFVSHRVAPEITIVWHSGEPLTLPPAYYDEAIARILDLANALLGSAVSVKFDIQTNGVLIDDTWCQFFRRHKDSLYLGVSCDGPAELHNSYRRNWGKMATYSDVVRGMDLLHNNGVKYKVIAVVTSKTLTCPDAFFNFFYGRRDQLSGFHFNILAQAHSTDLSLAYSLNDRPAYYAFFRRLIQLTNDAAIAGAPFEILNFSQGMARIMASRRPDAPRYIEESSTPLKSLNVDARGNITTFYAGLGIDVLADAYGDRTGLSIGNIYDISFEEMVRSPKLQRMMRDFQVSTHACEAECEYFSMCPGGFEITKRATLGTFDAAETTECVVHVKTLVDALLDSVCDHLDRHSAPIGTVE